LEKGNQTRIEPLASDSIKLGKKKAIRKFKPTSKKFISSVVKRKNTNIRKKKKFVLILAKRRSTDIRTPRSLFTKPMKTYTDTCKKEFGEKFIRDLCPYGTSKKRYEYLTLKQKNCTKNTV